jgi:ParB/RepB/Spo0J family partition protein
MTLDKMRLDPKLPINKIDISPDNVRKKKVEEGLDELAGSIKAIGLQQPVKVTQKNSRYELIVGQRRFLACKSLGWKTIPALVVQPQSRLNIILASFSENIYREKLNYRDKMEAAMQLYKELRSVDQVAKHLGVTSHTVKNYMGYAAVPDEMKKMVEEEKLGVSTAMEIVRNVPDEKKAIAIAKKVCEKSRGEEKRAYLDAVRDDPDQDLTEIDKRAQKQKYKKITIHLTEKVADSLAKACDQYDSDPADIAKDALIDWLQDQGFFGT